MSLLAVAGTNSAVAGGYDIANSLKIEGAPVDEELYQTLGTPTSTKIMTFSFWIKRTELATGNDYLFATDQQVSSPFNAFRIFFEGDTQFCVQNYSATVQNTRLVTPDYFRDTSAWYHFVVAIDTTQATASNRIKLYINGVYKSSYVSGIETQPGQNEDIYLESSRVLRVGAWKQDSGTLYRVGQKYLSEVHFVDGQQLAASDFGEFDTDTGIWKPKAYTGSYGNNGFYLDFENSASLGADGSGNGNNFTLSNITSVDQATDTPTNNFATLNPLFRFDECTIFAGATRVKKTTTNRWRTFVSSIGVTSGKWYAEFQNPLHATTGTDRFIGVAPATNFNQSIAATGGYLGGNSTETTDSIGYHGYTGNKFINGTGSSFGNTYAGETVAIALDMDNGYVYFAKANTWQNSGDPTSGATGTGGIALQLPNDTHYLACSIYDTNADFQGNFGGYTDFTIASAATDANGYGVFEFAPPSGYYALCTKNLAEFG